MSTSVNGAGGAGMGAAVVERRNDGGSRSTLDYDAFLKLLVTQMKNQDPTEPMDGTQYMAQLASFSNVEQAIRTNDKLDEVLTAVAVGQANGMMGRQVVSADGATSGVVRGYEIADTGVILQLEGGGRLALEPGVRVEEA